MNRLIRSIWMGLCLSLWLCPALCWGKPGRGILQGFGYCQRGRTHQRLFHTYRIWALPKALPIILRVFDALHGKRRDVKNEIHVRTELRWKRIAREVGQGGKGIRQRVLDAGTESRQRLIQSRIEFVTAIPESVSQVGHHKTVSRLNKIQRIPQGVHETRPVAFDDRGALGFPNILPVIYVTHIKVAWHQGI